MKLIAEVSAIIVYQVNSCTSFLNFVKSTGIISNTTFSLMLHSWFLKTLFVSRLHFFSLYVVQCTLLKSCPDLLLLISWIVIEVWLMLDSCSALTVRFMFFSYSSNAVNFSIWSMLNSICDGMKESWNKTDKN